MKPALLATLVTMALILVIACDERRRTHARSGRRTRDRARGTLGARRFAWTNHPTAHRRSVDARRDRGTRRRSVRRRRAFAFWRTHFRSARGPIARRSTGRCLPSRWRSLVGAALLVAMVPVALLWRRELRGVLSGARTGGIQGRGGRLEHALVVAEVALAMLIATGAALLVRSVANRYAIDPGINVNGVAVVDAIASADLNGQSTPAIAQRAGRRARGDARREERRGRDEDSAALVMATALASRSKDRRIERAASRSSASRRRSISRRWALRCVPAACSMHPTVRTPPRSPSSSTKRSPRSISPVRIRSAAEWAAGST